MLDPRGIVRHVPGPRDRVIVSCAVTGAIHVPSMTPHLPITPAQIAESAIGASEAGAAILHPYARDPQTLRILRELSLEPATPEEARAMLGLKGAAATKLAA